MSLKRKLNRSRGAFLSLATTCNFPCMHLSLSQWYNYFIIFTNAKVQLIWQPWSQNRTISLLSPHTNIVQKFVKVDNGDYCLCIMSMQSSDKQILVGCTSINSFVREA